MLKKQRNCNLFSGCTVKESGYKTDDEATSSSDDESFSYAGEWKQTSNRLILNLF